jgi:CHAT domain
MLVVLSVLTTTGIPSILAMTHSVLVATTRMLFGKFYQNLARGSDIAAALDSARVYLDNNPERYEVQRGLTRQMLKLEDWFLPALFSSGNAALLTAKPKAKLPPPIAKKSNLRAVQEAGFFGRRRELWDIERWFAVDKTRRISITGFGGQGKTELALEAGRWLMPHLTTPSTGSSR